MLNIKRGWVVVVMLALALGAFRVSRAADATPTPAPGGSETGTPQAQQTVQVVLVMDVSGSMNSPVFPKDLPADLAAIQQQIDAIEQSQEFKDLFKQMQSAQNDPSILQANQGFVDATKAVDKWLADNNYGTSKGAIARKLADLAISFGCDKTSASYLAAVRATSANEGLSRVTSACSKNKVTLTKDQQAQVKTLLAYLDSPDYRKLLRDASKAQSDYLTKLGSSQGMSTIMQAFQQPALKNYVSLSAQRAQIAAKYHFPSRLALSQQAAQVLIDLSRLDAVSGGTHSEIGLVSFSNDAFLVQPLTDDYDTLSQQVAALAPDAETNIGEGLATGLAELHDHGDPNQPSMIIFLSDGYADVGDLEAQILQTVPDQAKKENVKICAIGFGNKETDVDGKLLKTLADDTSGTYSFASSGQDVLSFFITCRQGLVSTIVQEFAGTVNPDQIVDAGTFAINNDLSSVTFTLSALSGQPTMQLVDPLGNTVDYSYAGAKIEQHNSVQLITVDKPKLGNWLVKVNGKDVPEGGTPYHVVITTSLSKSPLAAVSKAGPLGIIGIVVGVGICLVVIAAAVGAVIYFRRRGKGPQPPAPGADDGTTMRVQ